MTKQLVLVGVFFHASLTTFAQGSKEVTIKTKIYCDHCRKCESCGGRLEEVLFKQKGVRKVYVDDKKMIITVGYNPTKTTPGEIRKLISENGYDADDKKATPESYSKLDDCCKKQ